MEEMAGGAGFREVAEFGNEAGAKKKEDDREVPEDKEKVEAVAGARVGNGFLVFLGREVVGGGGGILSGSSGGRSGCFLGSCRHGLERSGGGVVSRYRERDEE